MDTSTRRPGLPTNKPNPPGIVPAEGENDERTHEKTKSTICNRERDRCKKGDST